MATEIFPKSLGRKVVKAEEIRHSSDYDVFFIASKEECVAQVETAIELIDLVDKYISEKDESEWKD